MRASGVVSAPVHRPGIGVTGLLPGGYFLGQGVGVGDAAIQALPAQDASSISAMFNQLPCLGV